VQSGELNVAETLVLSTFQLKEGIDVGLNVALKALLLVPTRNLVG
jgi:hypothetical protein